MSRKVKNIITVGLIIILIGAVLFTMNLAKENIKGTDNNHESSNEQKPPELPNGEALSDEKRMEPPSGEMPSDEGRPELPSGEKEDYHEETTNELKLTTAYYLAFGIESFLLSILLILLVMSRFHKQTIIETLDTNSERIIYGVCLIILTCTLTYSFSLITKKCFLTNNKSSNNNGEVPQGINVNDMISYSSQTKITTDTTIDSGDYESSNGDETAILADGIVNVTLDNINVNKTGDSSGGDNTSFYGINSAIVAKGGVVLNLHNINVVTDAVGANGVFSYGGSATTDNQSSDGTTVNIYDSTITTSKDNSGGIMTTGGGIMNATNLNITTSGISSAAIRTDRGGGIVVVDKGSYKTLGKGSPAIYSTANVSVSNAELTSLASEGIVIEGKNSVTLDNVILTDTNSELNGKSTTYKNIFLYQSMSGDAASGNSEFTAKNSKITTNKGDTLYVTNTSCTINLENNTIINNDKDGNFLRAQTDSWGNSGNNGGVVDLNLTNQIVSGNIVIDSISTLNMNMINSSFEGVINGDTTAKNISLNLDSTSKIKLMGDSYVNTLEDADTTYSNIDFNGYKLYVNGNSIN